MIDSGIGIAPADIPKALSQFGLVDSVLNRQHDGTGLGLPIARQIVERHGGSIEMDSRLGEGTTFRIRLPRSHDRKPPRSQNPEQPEGHSG